MQFKKICILRSFETTVNIHHCTQRRKGEAYEFNSGFSQHTTYNINYALRLRVFENMVLRRIFGPRREEVTGDWRRLHNEELNDLYSSPNIVRVTKSRKIR